MAYIVNDSSRGTIVVDACSIKHLCPRLNSEHLIEKGKGVKSFLDLLRYLGGHGYHIVIPEMVAFEVGEMGTQGKSLDKFFPKSTARTESAGLSQTNYAHPEERRQVQIFLEMVRTNRIPNVEMRPTDGPENVCERVTGLRQVAREPIDDISRRKIGELFSNRNQFGDLEILHVVSELHKKKPDMPIYVLTEDMTTLAPDIQRQCPYARLINANGLVEAMAGNGLSRALGICKKANPKALNSDRYMKVLQYNHGKRGPEDLFIIDHTNECKIGWLSVKMPFHAEMHNLGQANDVTSYDNLVMRSMKSQAPIGRTHEQYAALRDDESRRGA